MRNRICQILVLPCRTHKLCHNTAITARKPYMRWHINFFTSKSNIASTHRAGKSYWDALQVGWLFKRKAFSRGVYPAFVRHKSVPTAAVVWCFFLEEFISNFCHSINLPLKFRNDGNRRALISKQWVDENSKVPIRIQLLQSCVQKVQFELQIFHYFLSGFLAEGVVVAWRWISPLIRESELNSNFPVMPKMPKLRSRETKDMCPEALATMLWRKFEPANTANVRPGEHAFGNTNFDTWKYKSAWICLNLGPADGPI